MKIFLLSLFLNLSLFGQVFTKFYSNDLTDGDNFGDRVSINNYNIAINSPYDKPCGSIYIYFLKNNILHFRQKVIPDTIINGYFFGSPLLLSDSLLFVSTDGDLLIYKNSDSLYKIIKKISGSALDDFSRPVAEYKKDLLIGAPKSGEFDQGAVYYYKNINDSDWVLNQKLEPSILEEHSQFGNTIDFDSSFAVISAPLYGYISGPFRGMVFLYEKSDSGWIEKQRIYSPDSAYNQLFGRDLQIDNRRIAIGATGNPLENYFIGRIYIYAINDSGFAILEDSIYASDNFNGNYFGFSFKLKGDSLFVGANGNELIKSKNSLSRKWAYLFVKGKLGWEEKLKFGPTNQNSYNGFGYQVDFDNGNFIVGSPFDSDNKLYGGAVYLFQPNITSIKDENKIINIFDIQQNYPNPFNPTTTISYSLSKSGSTTLKVFDILGREIITLVNEEKPAGSYTVEFNASNLSSGIYFYSLTSGSFTMNKKMILMK
ncbi:MAG TPA: T9SS type A sorting domain-containing protein [Ignavibacteriaceae bacterium]|nr:T9SS type A sorting domain-containing protein [Ignavibacteriaceae bacterium]